MRLRSKGRLWSLLALSLLIIPAAAHSEEVFETFLEPNRIVEILSFQQERLAEILVDEGEAVEAGQLLASFDSRILQARLALLKKASSFHGAIDSAKALVNLRKSKLATLEDLAQSGNARPQEIETARTNLAIAQAQLLEAIEAREFKKSEQVVLLAQLEDKKITSPINGIVAKINSFAGDMAGVPGSEPIMTLVQLDPLTAAFHLPPAAAAGLQENMSVPLVSAGTQFSGAVKFVSPLIEPQSGTVLVRVEVENPDSSYLSGSRVSLKLNPIMENN